MRIRSLACLAGLLALAAGTGCSERPVTYDVRGQVVEYSPGERRVRIRHEEIPGYMAAMTMPFEARDASALQGLRADDVVTFKLHVLPKDSWVDGFVVLSNAPSRPPETRKLDDPSAVSFYREVPELKEGDPVPDYGLTNQLGKAFRLADYRGNAVAVTFIFTRCPLPNFCPRMSDHFAGVQKRLKERPAAPGNWRLLSVSIDPVHDTPETLREYGQRFGQDPARWTLATGSYEEIQPLGSHFGLYFSRDVSPANMNHNLRTAVIDPSGRVHQVFIGNEWTPDELADSIAAAAAKR